MIPRPHRPGRKRLFPVIIALTLSLFFPGLLGADLVKIAILIPREEPGLEGGPAYLRGAELAVAEVNSNEGKQGAQFLLFLKGGAFHQPASLNSLRDLFFEQRPQFLLGALQKEAILPVSRLAYEHRAPFLVFPVDFMEAASTGEEPPNLFWISPTPESYQRAAVRAIAQSPGQKLYLLAQGSPMGRNWVKYFWEEMGRLKPEAQRLGETFIPSPVDDFTPYIRNILATHAEVCLSHLGVKDWLRFYRAAQGQGYFRKVNHFELEMGNLESLLSMKKKVPEGIGGVSAFPFWGLTQKETRQFVGKYRKNTGVYPSLAALSGYVSVYAIFHTIKKTGTSAAEKTLSALEGLSFPTPVGPMTIRKSDHRAMWPIWYGSTQNKSEYPFPVLGDLKAMGPDSFSP